MLELESELLRERARLGELRKRHYHLAGNEDGGSNGSSKVLSFVWLLKRHYFAGEHAVQLIVRHPL